MIRYWLKQVHGAPHRYTRGGHYPETVDLPCVGRAAGVADGELLDVGGGPVTFIRRQLFAVTDEFETVGR